MPSNFPVSDDSFSVPGSPSTTPLASAGTGSRNHWEHHRDLGDAVVKIEQNVPVLTHDHSGTGPRATAKLKQDNTHEEADTDEALSSIHHTLGTGAYQSAAGNHTHDPRYVRKDGNVAEAITGIKTFDRPSIADFSNSQHNHSSVIQGGPIVATVRREEFNPSIRVFPVSQYLGKFPTAISVPANIRLGGQVVFDIQHQADQLQAATFSVYLAPIGSTQFNSSTFATNFHTPGVSRWPGARNGTSDTNGWFSPTESVRKEVVVPFQFASVSNTARNNYGVFVLMAVESGAGWVFLNQVKLMAQYEVNLV